MNTVYTSTAGGAYDTLLPPDIKNKSDIITLGVTNEKGIPIGVIAAQVKNYSYEIIWLFVREEERRKGVASGLLREFLSVIRKTNQIYPVNVIYDSSSEDIFWFMDNLDNFSQNCIGRRYLIDPDSRKDSKLINSLMKYRPKKTELFFDQSELIRKYAYAKLQSLGIDLQTLVSDSTDYFVRELCKCHIGNSYRGNRIDALILVKELSEQELEITYAYAENKMHFAQVLIEILRQIDEKYPDKTLSITALNNESDRLVRHLFGDATHCERMFRGEWNYLL